MRRWNRRIAKLSMVLMLLHGLLGSYMLLDISTISLKMPARLLFGLVGIHAVLSILLTVEAVRAGSLSRHWYPGLNAGFWIKRITGAAILILMAFHIHMYSATVNGQVILKEFTLLRMISQLLFVLAIFIHVFVSIRPMLIKQGILKYRERTGDAYLVLSVFLLVFVMAIVAYYIRWKQGGVQ